MTDEQERQFVLSVCAEAKANMPSDGRIPRVFVNKDSLATLASRNLPGVIKTVVVTTQDAPALWRIKPAE
ncbi:MAG TPA: hypothetical protein VL475_05320 [Planctomycetaceae bacterium]|jgi:hypothetical protein|nr:hypothetical protein [Planctomycetaceae bacterium]